MYRDMGTERSIRKVAQHLSKSSTLIKDWSAKHGWVERVAAYDSYIDQETRKKREKDIIEMKDRHAGLATAMLAKAAKGLLKIKDEHIKPQDVARMIEVGSKLERLSRGESTENIEATGKDGGPIQTETQVVFYIPDNGRDAK